MYQIIKTPEFENDDVLLKFPDYQIDQTKFITFMNLDPYFKLKWEKFANKDICYRGFEAFKDRPSMRGYTYKSLLGAVIYTSSVQKTNPGVNYGPELFEDLETELKKPGNRRVILRFIDSFIDYKYSKDISCIAYIQYLMIDKKLHVKIVYRASDITNEFFYDFVLIYQYFIGAFYFEKVDITFYSTTAQNIDELQKACIKIDSMRV